MIVRWLLALGLISLASAASAGDVSVGRHADVRVEALHIESDRPSRAYALETAFQRQTVLQSSLRFTY